MSRAEKIDHKISSQKRVVEVPLSSPAAASADWIGSMKLTIQIGGEIVSPANDESDWEALRD
jgi:hypothetical protein